MNKIEISELFIYPIKSTKGIKLEESKIEKIGLKYDRIFAILNVNNKIITARENPRLLKIQSNINDTSLVLSAPGKKRIELLMKAINDFKKIEVTIFKDKVCAKTVNEKLNEWISDVIQESSKLIIIDSADLRKVKEKYKGKEKDYIAFSDASPIHLISEASLRSLNMLLEKGISIKNFRPNIVVKGCEAYEEDTWKKIKIGNCIFEVGVRTARCSFITIDPDTIERDENQEPLRTLSKLRNQDNKVNFGIYLIPIKLGTINKDDEVEVEYIED